MPAKTSSFRRELDQFFNQAGFNPHILCESSQSDIVLQIASHNFGIGFSSYSIARALRIPHLTIVPMKPMINRTIYYVTLKKLLDYPSIQSFTKFVKQYDFSHL